MHVTERKGAAADPQRVLGAVSWILLVAVIVGGESLLRFLSAGEGMAPHREQFFRAGHGHAGVLTIVGILYSQYLGKTRLVARTQVVAWCLYAIGVFALAGGMFLHAYTGDAGQSSPGTWLAAGGGVLIAGTILFLAWHLFGAQGDES